MTNSAAKIGGITISSNKNHKKKYLIKQKKNFVPKMKTIISSFVKGTPTDGQTDNHSMGCPKKEFIIRRAYIYKYICALLIMGRTRTSFT